MPGGEMMKGLVDGIVNCKLGGVESGESVSHLVDVTGMALVTNERQLVSILHVFIIILLIMKWVNFYYLLNCI